MFLYSRDRRGCIMAVVLWASTAETPLVQGGLIVAEGSETFME